MSVPGALAALGDTPFPATSVAEGLRQELAPAARGLLRLRLLHPRVALALVPFLMLSAVSVLQLRPNRPAVLAGFAVVGLVLGQWIAGVGNVLLLAPVWMQLAHLLLADLLWLALVILVVQMTRIE